MISRRFHYNGYLIIVLAAAVVFMGCQKKMRDHGRIRPLAEDSFFADRRSARPQVTGTVSQESAARAVGGESGARLYHVYCAVCHGERGEGDGMVVKKGFTRPRSFQRPPLRSASPAYLVRVMTEGLGDMDSSRDQLDMQGRRAVAAYITNQWQKERYDAVRTAGD